MYAEYSNASGRLVGDVNICIVLYGEDTKLLNGTQKIVANVDSDERKCSDPKLMY